MFSAWISAFLVLRSPLQSLWSFGAGRQCKMCSGYPGQWPTLLDRLLMEIRVDFEQWIRSLPRLMKNEFLPGKTEMSWMLYHNPGVPPSINLPWHTKHGDNQLCFSGHLLSMFILRSLNNKLFHCLSLSGPFSCERDMDCLLPCSEWGIMKLWVASRDCYQGFRDMKLNTPTLNIFCGFLVHQRHWILIISSSNSDFLQVILSNPLSVFSGYTLQTLWK